MDKKKRILDLTAEEYISAFKDRVKNDIVNASSTRVNTGRLLFTTSTFSIGFFVTLGKIASPGESIDSATGIGLVILAFSAIYSIVICLPVEHDTDKQNQGIDKLYRKFVIRTKREIIIWSCLWGIGILIATYGTFF